jgi:uncharacterized membrane protein YkoI
MASDPQDPARDEQAVLELPPSPSTRASPRALAWRHSVPRKHLFAVVLMSLLASPSFAATATSTVTPITQDTAEDDVEAGEQLMRRELELFRDASISLGEAMAIARKLHTGSRIADIAFDGASGHPIYRVKTFKEDRVLQHTIDARTGDVSGNQIVSSLQELSAEDRSNLIALQAVRQELSDAVAVAERAASGQAISGGLTRERGKLNFVIVVVSGDRLKQVMLEPPRIKRH